MARLRQKKTDEEKGNERHHDCAGGIAYSKHDHDDVDVMRRYSGDEIDEMAAVLKADGVLSVPTDTVYGVSARMLSQKAQDNLRHVKNRPLTKAFPIMCADLAQVETICEVDETSRKIIQAFMPGPLTIILKKKAEVPSFVNGGLDTLAIRLATSKELHDLIQAVGEPLYMTSANQSGQPVCTSLDEIEQQCPLLDGMMEGTVSFGQASTIVDGTKADLPILRQGPLTKEQILNVLK